MVFPWVYTRVFYAHTDRSLGTTALETSSNPSSSTKTLVWRNWQTRQSQKLLSSTDMEVRVLPRALSARGETADALALKAGVVRRTGSNPVRRTERTYPKRVVNPDTEM